MQRPRTILVVGAQRCIRRGVYALRRLGYAVCTAHDEAGAFEAIRAQRPELMFLYDMDRGVDAFGVLRRLKGEVETRDVPVILAMGGDSDLEVFRGLPWGLDG